MSKRDAICACKNVLELIGDLQDRLPDQYADSVESRITNMSEFIETKWESEFVTAKMDNAIRNIWDGLRKWDRNDEYNNDLFYGLAMTTIAEDNVAATTPAKPPKRGLVDEVGHESAQEPLTEEQKKILEKMTPVTVTVGTTATVPAATTKITADNNVLSANTLTQHREHIISDVCRTFSATHNRVILIEQIRHGDILQVLKKTTSERSIQLIEAAFAAGKIAGAYLLTERLKTVLK